MAGSGTGRGHLRLTRGCALISIVSGTCEAPIQGPCAAARIWRRLRVISYAKQLRSWRCGSRRPCAIAHQCMYSQFGIARFQGISRRGPPQLEKLQMTQMRHCALIGTNGCEKHQAFRKRGLKRQTSRHLRELRCAPEERFAERDVWLRVGSVWTNLAPNRRALGPIYEHTLGLHNAIAQTSIAAYNSS